MSGESTYKFDHVVSDEIVKQQQELINQMKEMASKLHNDIATMESNLNANLRNEVGLIHQEYSSTKQFVEASNSAIIGFFHGSYLIIIRILLSWPMRLINYFTHWYFFNMFKGDFDYGKRGYYVTIQPTCMLEYDPEDALEKQKLIMQQYRKHLKEYKSEGGTYKQLIQNTLRAESWYIRF